MSTGPLAGCRARDELPAENGVLNQASAYPWQPSEQMVNNRSLYAISWLHVFSADSAHRLPAVEVAAISGEPFGHSQSWFVPTRGHAYGSIWRGSQVRDEALQAIRIRSSACLIVIDKTRANSAAVSADVANGYPVSETLRSPENATAGLPTSHVACGTRHL